MTAAHDIHGRTMHASQSIMVERYEAKYVIPRYLVPKIREFIEPFCIPDPNCSGDPPEYVITTMQLDDPWLRLHKAKENEAIARFKLRARIYGTDGVSPVFTEVKRKIMNVILKTRARVPREKWCRELLLNPRRKLDFGFRSDKEQVAFLEFVRLIRQIGAQPTTLIRYTRESYVSVVDEYARVTMDRNLLYQATNSWDCWGDGNIWRRMDSVESQNKNYPFSGIILELKSMTDVPTWQIELVEKFDLVRAGNCKYSTAIWTEALFSGEPELPSSYAMDMLSQ